MTLRCSTSHSVTAMPAARSRDKSAVLAVDSLVLDIPNGKAIGHGRVLDLQPRQLELLAYLARHAGRVVTRPMIAKAVWKDETAMWTNVITVNVCMLRRELERVGHPAILHTVRGRGYRLGEGGGGRRPSCQPEPANGPEPPLGEAEAISPRRSARKRD